MTEEQSKVSEPDVRGLIFKGLEKYRREKVGAVLRPRLGHTEATRDAIRHFADGLGDPNPLWRDETYAGNSPYGTIVAPPSFLNAVSEGQAIVGLPGLVATYVGSEWSWNRVIRCGDGFAVTNELLNLQELDPRDGRLRFLQSGILRYADRQGSLIGSCQWNLLRSEAKPGGVRQAKSSPPDRSGGVQRYSPEALEEIFAAIEAEEIRGRRPRYFEEVAGGETLRPVVKGPLALSDMVAWAMGLGWHRMELAHGPKLRFLRANPGLAYTDPETGAPEPIANSHFLPAASRLLLGSALPLDLGFQRVCWLGHLVTNWMSDYGFLLGLKARLHELVRFGDTTWCEGRVAGKRLENGQGLVDLEIWARNQRGERTAAGQALLRLPLKDAELPRGKNEGENLGA